MHACVGEETFVIHALSEDVCTAITETPNHFPTTDFLLCGEAVAAPLSVFALVLQGILCLFSLLIVSLFKMPCFQNTVTASVPGCQMREMQTQLPPLPFGFHLSHSPPSPTTGSRHAEVSAGTSPPRSTVFCPCGQHTHRQPAQPPQGACITHKFSPPLGTEHKRLSLFSFKTRQQSLSPLLSLSLSFPPLSMAAGRRPPVQTLPSYSKYVPVIAQLFTGLAKRGDVALALAPAPKEHEIYVGTRVPEVPIEDYLSRWARYSLCTPEVFLIVVLYVDKLSFKTGLVISSRNVHRVLLTALVLAAKTRDDIYYSNKVCLWTTFSNFTMFFGVSFMCS